MEREAAGRLRIRAEGFAEEELAGVEGHLKHDDVLSAMFDALEPGEQIRIGVTWDEARMRLDLKVEEVPSRLKSVVKTKLGGDGKR